MMTGLAPVGQRATGEALDEGGPRHFVGGLIANDKVPRHIWLMAEPLPRNASGKFLRRELRDSLAAALPAG